MFHDIKFLNDGSLKINGLLDDKLKFVIEDQLKDKQMWAKFVEPFKTKEDSDSFWRCEFFGKEMRGASLAYKYSQDEELYNILTAASKDLLSTQEENGRISSYPIDMEFTGWDMWGRKYVLTGLHHYYDICKDKNFKKEILSSLSRHLEYIIDHVGPAKEGKKEITTTSSWWGCVNSCTILEPTLALYKLTNNQRYFDFAKYIISTGGCADCNLIELALKNELHPYQYPVTKAYETMSFFEGLLAYYEITKEEKYFKAVSNFIENVAISDLTLIGCSGCTHELFDNSSLKQSEYSTQIMQETCVAVTWMRISSRLFFLTGDKKYLDRIEQSGLNDVYGSLNENHEEQYNLLDKKFVKGMTFDSYSPLYDKCRGKGTGGYLEFSSGGCCGCCVAIGACGVALMPLMSVLSSKEGLIISSFFTGTIKTNDTNGDPVTINMNSNYPTSSFAKISLEGKIGSKVNLYIKEPFDSSSLRINEKIASFKDGFAYVELEQGKEINISFSIQLKAHYLNNKVAFTYGNLTLAEDENKSPRDLTSPIVLPSSLDYEFVKPQKGELIRIVLNLSNKEKLLLSDYQSCGKFYNKKNNRINVWINYIKAKD